MKGRPRGESAGGVGGREEGGGGSNILFADGHVKYLWPIQVSSGHNGKPGEDQASASMNGRGNYDAAATDTMYLDAGHTQGVAGTFSLN